MNESSMVLEELIQTFRERAKELNCLYQVEEILSDGQASLEALFSRVIKVVPGGWSYPEICQARVLYNDDTFQEENFQESPWKLSADIHLQSNPVGRLEVYYSRHPANDKTNPFLPEEKKLIHSIADRLSQKILHQKLDPLFWAQEAESRKSVDGGRKNWQVVLDLIGATDRDLYARIPRRMLNFLCYSGIDEAIELMETIGVKQRHTRRDASQDGVNRPLKKSVIKIDDPMAQKIFAIAETYFSDEIILNYIQKWIGENKFSHLLNVLENHSSSIHDIVNALARYQPGDFKGPDVPAATFNAIKVALIRRFISRRLEVINVAKQGIRVEDFFDFAKRLIYPAHSDGKVGGKSSGLFMAMHIVKRQVERFPELAGIKIPKTWYIVSDGLLDFTNHNQLQEMREYKYHQIDHIRLEYDNIVQLFKNSTHSTEITKGLSMALDDFGDSPLIIRSSSLLEDSVGASFSGKYKSLFIANQGSKQDRLAALQDAIAEVYASLYAPDPLEYRAERGLLDFQEEMGILIQEVVGTRVGPYLFPAFGGVAFSRNEFRWSHRIKNEDGLIRIVPGLGTRAVDRLSDDYPMLISPGQPQLHANTTLDETVRYAPRFMDVINLETNEFETVSIEAVLKAHGRQFPQSSHIFSVYRNDMLRIAAGLVDYESDFFVATFEGLIRNTPFVGQIKTLLAVLEEQYGTPIDIEFAADADDLYLLQCRSQSATKGGLAPPIPTEVAPESIVFSADKYVSNGLVADISHIVYVTPEGYDRLGNLEDLKAVGRVVSRLNKLLPKRQFVLMGPGRWGSRGDIKLGVQVTYSDINNTAALIEVAFKKGNYEPELSFGTHFFQDLVEASIRYLPLYPDDSKTVFNREFLEGSPNMLPELMPEYGHLAEVVRVVDVAKASAGRVLSILMNGDEGKALGLLAQPSTVKTPPLRSPAPAPAPLHRQEEHWKWRLHMAERIAATLDGEQFGVTAMYVLGSTKNGTAGPKSDIDVLIHFSGSPGQLSALNTWLEGWSLCLAAINRQRTGYTTDGLLDVHVITDADIAKKTSWAMKIGAVSDAARVLKLKER